MVLYHMDDNISRGVQGWGREEEKESTEADLGGGCRGCVPPPHLPEMTCGFLMQLVFCKKTKKTMWFIGVEVEQKTSAPPPKKILDLPLEHAHPCNPGRAFLEYF